jgi:hypothetical protein
MKLNIFYLSSFVGEPHFEIIKDTLKEVDKWEHQKMN